MNQPAEAPPAAARLIDRVVHLGRLARILLALIFAIAVTLAVTPLIDELYLANFYNINTRAIPAFLSTALGLIYYGLGWRLIVGYAGEVPEPRRAILWYVAVGAAACILVIVLLIIGAVTGTME